MIPYIKEHYANTKNTDIAAHCGISLTTLHRIARENGLRKDPAFMAQLQRAASAAGVKAVKALSPEEKKARMEKAIAAGRKFKKGEFAHKDKTPEWRAAFFKKCTEKWKAARNLERARVDFGLPQRTKFRFALHTDPIKNKRTYNLRYYLRKKGYIVDRYKVSLDETTKRSEYCEKKAKYLGFKLNFI